MTQALVIPRVFRFVPGGLIKESHQQVPIAKYGTADRVMRTMEGSIQMARGDLLNMAESDHGEESSQLMDEAEAATLKKYAYIAGQVKLGIRIPTLEFHHYRTIVGMHSDFLGGQVSQSKREAFYREWIAWSAEGPDGKDRPWSITELKKAMKAELKRLARDRAIAAASESSEVGVVYGDFEAVASDRLADHSVSLMFTDPPYNDESVDLYPRLAAVADRVLVSGGSFVTYLGQRHLATVIEAVESEGLSFYWPIAVRHTGQTVMLDQLGVRIHWKPMLWFTKGSRGDPTDIVHDLIESKQEKSDHEWQQSLVEATHMIEHLTKYGDLVFDPCCGGGTTAVAAKQQSRQWLTCDIDEGAVTIARQRIADTEIA